MPGPWGKAIEGLRLSKRLARGVVAKRAKMTATTYGRIERGQHTQTRKLQDIADVFGVSIDQVLLPGGVGQARTTGADPSVRELQAQIDMLTRRMAEIDARTADVPLDRAFTKAVERERVRAGKKLQKK